MDFQLLEMALKKNIMKMIRMPLQLYEMTVFQKYSRTCSAKLEWLPNYFSLQIGVTGKGVNLGVGL